MKHVLFILLLFVCAPLPLTAQRVASQLPPPIFSTSWDRAPARVVSVNSDRWDEPAVLAFVGGLAGLAVWAFREASIYGFDGTTRGADRRFVVSVGLGVLAGFALGKIVE